MHNVEFKTGLDDVARVEAALRTLGAADAGVLVQRDTYFRVPAGRLKLREMPGGAELIAYDRDESGSAMSSRYTLTPIADPAAVRAALFARHGVRGVVEKTRRLWLYRNARIHLDHVAGLGSFMEIEVVEPRSEEEGRALLEELIDAMGLDPEAAVRGSYIDVMEAAGMAPSPGPSSTAWGRGAGRTVIDDLSGTLPAVDDTGVPHWGRLPSPVSTGEGPGEGVNHHMDRIRPLNRDEAHPDAQPYFDQDERFFGLILNPTRVLAHRPPILAAARQLGRSVGKDGTLPAGLRALVCVRVATIVGCPFWVDINAAGGGDAGVSDEKIAALPDYGTSPLYDDAERAALELADAVTATPAEVSDDLYARLRAHYDDAQMVELAATAAMENFRARFNRVFRVEPNSLYCPVPGHTEQA